MCVSLYAATTMRVAVWNMERGGPTGLTELVGTHKGQNALLNRENDRGCASGSCYYAGL